MKYVESGIKYSNCIDATATKLQSAERTITDFDYRRLC